MLTDSDIPAVEPDELLARYVVASSHIRSSDKTGVPTLFGLWSRPLACITTPKAID